MTSPPHWHTDNRECPHFNEHVCPTCDFDRYYASNYPDCPWRVVDIEARIEGDPWTDENGTTF